MLRTSLLFALAASSIATGCFSDVSPGISEGDTDPSGGSPGTSTGTSAEASGDTNIADTEQSSSGAVSSVGGSDSTGGTGSGSEGNSGSGSNSGSGTGDPAPTVCPIFFDAFDDGIKDPLWRQSFPNSSSEIDDELVINVTGILNDEFVTMVVLPEGGGLQGSTMRIELGIPPADPGVRTTLWVSPTDGAGRISFNLAQRAAGPTLEARISPELGSPQIVATLEWDPLLMSWMQLREAEGMLYFEISSDGVSFETFHEMSTPFDVSSAEVGFAGHNDQALPGDVTVSVRTFEFVCAP